MLPIFKTLFGDPTEKRLKSYFSDLEDVKRHEEILSKELTSIEAVQQKTRDFMARFEGLSIEVPEELAKIKSILSEIRLEAFAVHRIACRLIFGKEFTFEDGQVIVWDKVPYDVQIVGAMALHDRSIAEMRTGEGKTLVATIAAYLNALAGMPVHIVTVNDYLARRDAKEMSIVYGTLGLTTGVIVHNQSPEQKREEYAKNVVYATNNELGFDYLRDNMLTKPTSRVMGPRFFALVDEVDSILVDEARTPLIISSPDMEPTSKYVKFAVIAKTLKEHEHYKVDEKQRTAALNEAGIAKLEEILGISNIYVSDHYNDIHHIENALKAETIYKRDIDYLVRDDEVLIIDEHTGRVLSGRRYSDGLHQALEAKENVTIQQESKTLASITFQNYFRLYKKLGGMTGTAKTEEEEFYKIYGLEVMVVPTNRPMIRKDRSDLLFKNEVGKYTYLTRLIKELHAKWQPILVGTVSVAKSEYLSDLLTKEGIPHKVLNAKQDANEAEIISKAGILGAVTIATNMAGRGTDIKIDDEVRNLTGSVSIGEQTYELGGLFVIGTEKHETRRIDNQLRGRSGRQGDPGLSEFLVSPTDDIMRIFGGDKLFAIFNTPMFASLPSDEPIAQSSTLTSRITSVQKQVEGRNFDIRKHILEYDDVLNHHRLIIYSRRNKILDQSDIHEEIVTIFKQIAEGLVAESLDENEKISATILIDRVNEFAGRSIMNEDDVTDIDEATLAENVTKAFLRTIEEKQQSFGESFISYEKQLLLRSIDELWMHHIDDMAHLREEVAFEGFAQKNPLIVYKERAYDKFSVLIREISFKVAKGLLTSEQPQEIAAQDLPSMEILESALSDITDGNPEGLVNLLSNEAIRDMAFGKSEDGVRVYTKGNNSKK